MTITFSDAGSPTNSITRNITINVVDNNDNAPMFTKPYYEITLSEDNKLHKVFMTLTATDKDSNILTYQIQNPSSIEAMIGVYSLNGSLYLNRSLDFEQQKSVIFSVLAFDNSTNGREDETPRFGTTVVKIIVQDVNDNAPTFLPQTSSAFNITINVLPDEPKGSIIFTLSASDVDTTSKDQLTFNLLDSTMTNDSFPFQVSQTSGVISLSRKLTLEDPLEFVFAARVTDESNLMSETIQIVVKQVVGNTAPVFSVDTYIFSVIENHQPNTVSFNDNNDDQDMQVIATDLDSGSSGKLMYQIVSAERDTPFSINNQTGEIHQLKMVNYEENQSFTFLVQAIDHGHPKRSASALVKIHIKNVNEPPIFTQTMYNTTISEATLAGQPILMLSYSDPDTPTKSQLNATVKGEWSSFFQVQPITGALILRQSLSFNQRSEYMFNITLKDNGVPQQLSVNEAQVFIRVTKAIANGPFFNQSRYIFSIKENQAGVLGALDIVSDPNTKPLFSIVGEHDRLLFNLTEDGLVEVLGKGLDFETQQLHNFLVQVYEAISPQSTNRAIVTVIVEDVNDNNRNVSVDSINKTLSESTLAGTILTVFEVTDADSANITQFTASLSPKQDHFAVLQTGSTVSLILTKELDYEFAVKHQFLIDIIGNFDESTEVVSVFIGVTDVNEYRPVFEKSVYIIKVAQNSPLNSTLDTIKATDKDRSFNDNSIKYTMFPSSDVIYLDPITGEVIQTGSFMNNDQLRYEFLVFAKDSGIPAFASDTTLTIMVTPQNLNRPVFTKTFYQKQILENSMLGLTLLHLEAEDKDIVGKPLVYDIKTGNIDNHFNVTADGYLIIAKNIDREAFNEFNLSISVRDSGSPVLFSDVDASVRITVLDQNDNSPKFTSQNVINILETFPIGESILTVKATDVDQGVFGVIQYLFQDGSLLERFSIDSSSGEIRLLKFLKPQTITLYVTARDGGGNEAHQAIILTIADVNSPPSFSKTEASISVSESVQVGTMLFTFLADDPDENDKLTYTFTEDTNTFDEFMLQESNKLIVSSQLDFETRNGYTIKVIARDLYNTTSSNVFTLSINVINKFFKPAFEKSLYEITLNESAITTSTEVIQLNATAESGITFNIVSESPQTDSFAINQQNGKITLVKQLDYEIFDKHRLVVRALTSTDTYSDAIVIITVNNINEFRPVFTKPVYEFSIRSPTYNNSIVGSIQAEDGDKDKLGRVSYQLIAKDSGTVPFVLNENHIVASSNILFEAENTQYTFNVRAADNGDPALTSATDAEVLINVIDNTDRVPYLQPTVVEKDLAEDTPSGSTLLQLKATDPDSGIFGLLTFSIEPSKDASMFTVNAQTGQLALASNSTLDYNVQNRYVLVARVTDGVKLTSVGTVIFNIVDKNSHKPKFVQSNYKTTIADTTPIDTSLVTVYADDNDVVTGHVIFYRILDGNDVKHFQIDEQTGEILLTKAIQPDFNGTGFTLTIDAYNTLSDGTELVAVEKATVSIDVLKRASLYTPQFEKSEYNATIQEPGSLNDIQLRVVASILKDDKLSDTIRYSIQNFKYSDVFTINPLTGSIKLLKVVDREAKDQYIFTVVAGTTFHGQKDKATVIVTISDTNDNFPLPKNDVYQLFVEINEDLPVGSSVVTIESSDIDLSDNGRLQYTITSGILFGDISFFCI